MIMQCVIFDIDGTLADNEHRQSLVVRSEPDWDTFFSLLSMDEPKQQIVDLCNILYDSKKYKIFLVTGRPKRYKEDTQSWLIKYGILYDAIYMREDNDRRPDYVVKKEIHDIIISSGYVISFVVDDREETVRMWRKNGVICLQCADHKF